MPFDLTDAYRVLGFCKYSEQDFSTIITQLAETDNLDYFSEVLFSVKEIEGEKFFLLNGRMKHKEWAEIHLEFIFLKPARMGIEVYVINPNLSVLKFSIYYHNYIKNNILDLTEEFKFKRFIDILSSLKSKFETFYPYARIRTSVNSIHQEKQLQSVEKSVESIKMKPQTNQSIPAYQSEHIKIVKKEKNNTENLTKWANKIIQQKIEKINSKASYTIF